MFRFFESQGLPSGATLPIFQYWALDDEAGAAIAKEKVLEEATSSLGTLFYLIKEGKRKKGYVRASNIELLA